MDFSTDCYEADQLFDSLLDKKEIRKDKCSLDTFQLSLDHELKHGFVEPS